MLVVLTQIPTKLGTDLHNIVVIRAMFVLSVFNNVAGVSNLKGWMPRAIARVLLAWGGAIAQPQEQ